MLNDTRTIEELAANFTEALAENARMSKRMMELEAALEFYADHENWFDKVEDLGWGETWRTTAVCEMDMGDRARAALKGSAS